MGLGTSINVWKYINDDLMNRLKGLGLFPERISPLDDGACMVFKNQDITLHIEFYNDGDIAMVATDGEHILESLDLTTETLLDTITRYVS